MVMTRLSSFMFMGMMKGNNFIFFDGVSKVGG